MLKTNKFRIVLDHADELYFIEGKRRFWFGWERVASLSHGLRSLESAESCLLELMRIQLEEAKLDAIKRSKNRIEVVKIVLTRPAT